MKTLRKAAALAMALCMWTAWIVGLLYVLEQPVQAAVIRTGDNFKVYNSSGTQTDYITNGSTVTIVFDYMESDSSITSGLTAGQKYTASKFTVGPGTNWSKSSAAKLQVTALENSGSGYWDMELRIEGIVYRNSNRNQTFQLTNVEFNGYGSGAIAQFVDLDIPLAMFYKASGGGGSTDDDVETYTSDIVVESVNLLDAKGERLDKVTKDTDPFTMVVTFVDYGLMEVDVDELSDSSFEVILTNSGGLVPGRGNRGTLKYTNTTSSWAPRFRAEFTAVTYNGTGNSITFQARYDVYGQDIKGEGTATVHQAGTEEEEEDEVAAPTPYIIVTQFSYGIEQIEAGTDFTLGLTFQNTSQDIALENIVMTVTPPDDLSIASASNTYYINGLEAGGTLTRSVDLWVKPGAQVGSHSVQVEFSYQYISGKERKENKTTETIAVPVTQIDRFEVDPYEEVPSAVVGEEVYLTISFVNRGKSTTYNISATVNGNLEILAPIQHFGNLETGKSDTLDVIVIPQEPGEFYGEIVVQYEDENTNQKEIPISFTMYVDAPYVPPEEPPPDDMGMMEEEAGINVFSLVFCLLGGLLIAGPIALTLIKRAKVKGNEDFDEDF